MRRRAASQIDLCPNEKVPKSLQTYLKSQPKKFAHANGFSPGIAAAGLDVSSCLATDSILRFEVALSLSVENNLRVNLADKLWEDDWYPYLAHPLSPNCKGSYGAGHVVVATWPKRSSNTSRIFMAQFEV